MRVASLIPLVLTAVALCQCASGPPAAAEYPLKTGDDVAIVYQGGGAVLALQNESSPAASQAPVQGEVASKVATDELMKRLLGLLQQQGFFEASGPAEHPQAKASLTLVINSQRYVCSRLPLQMSSVDEVQRFQGYTEVFRAAYDNTEAYRAASLDARDFYRENERLQENAKKAAAGRGDQ